MIDQLHIDARQDEPGARADDQEADLVGASRGGLDRAFSGGDGKGGRRRRVMDGLLSRR